MDGDLRLYPLWPTLTGDMLLRPVLPVSPTSSHHISLDQLKDFIGSGEGGGTSVTIGDQPPPTLVAGNLWWDSVGGQLYVYYLDPSGDGSWVAATNQPGAPGEQGPMGLQGPAGSANMSGMVAGQIPIAATATTVTSSGNLSGDVTSDAALATTIAANAVTTAKIANSAVTYAKVQNVTAARLLGNSTGSAAPPSEITLGTGLSFAGTTLNAASGAGTAPTVTTKTTSYTVQASDLGNTLILSGSAALTLPSGIFTPGKTLGIHVTGSTWSISNTTGLTMVGLTSTGPLAGTSGTFVANADGTTLNFIPGTQAASLTTLGAVKSLTATTNQFVTGLSGSTLTTAAVGFTNITGTATVAQGGTGATTAAAALTALGGLSTTTAASTYVPLTGNSVITGNLEATNGLKGDAAIVSGGINASFSFEERTALGTVWSLYASSAAANIFQGSNLLSITNTGNLTITGGTATKVGGGSWAAPSDIRLKREVTEYKSGLEQVLALKPIAYRYNGKGGLPDDGRSYVGLDAGATETVMPELVGSMKVTMDPVKSDEPSSVEPDTEIKTIDASALVYALVNSCKELNARVEALEAMLAGAER